MRGSMVTRPRVNSRCTGTEEGNGLSELWIFGPGLRKIERGGPGGIPKEMRWQLEREDGFLAL